MQQKKVLNSYVREIDKPELYYTKNKMIECEICKRTFTRKESLKRHILLKRCNKKWTRLTYPRKQMEITEQCYKCNRRFTTNGYREHNKIFCEYYYEGKCTIGRIILLPKSIKRHCLLKHPTNDPSSNINT